MGKNPIHKTWDEFKVLVGNYAEKRFDYIYRGQSNSQWSLTSTWHRLKDASNDNLQAFWPLVDEIYDDVSMWTGYHWNLQNPRDKGAFLSFLQHHRFPTPLLDWTQSPYIAAYFAYEGVNEKTPDTDHVNIFVFDHLTFRKDWEQILTEDSSKQHVSVLRTSPKGNPNQVVQQGVHTYSTVRDQKAHMIALEIKTNQNAGQERAYFLEVLLPANDKPRVMRELKMMGITAMSLFPGVDGVCKAYNEAHFSANTIGQSQEAFRRSFMESLKTLPHGSTKKGTDQTSLKNNASSPISDLLKKIKQ